VTPDELPWTVSWSDFAESFRDVGDFESGPNREASQVRNKRANVSGQVRIAPSFIQEAVAVLKTSKRLRRGDLRVNPITGYVFAHGVDPTRRQVLDAAVALAAKARFAQLHPDLPALPLCWNEREALKACGKAPHLGHLVAWFALSLAGVGYDLDDHPTFENYVRNEVLAKPELRNFLPADLIDRFERGGVR
jgi:hypothetical protein